MTQSKERHTAYMKAYREANALTSRATDRRSAARRYARKAKTVKPFGGVDGEGVTETDSHRYVLLRGADELLTASKGLHHFKIFEFLCNLPTGTQYVSFFFDYDVTMIMRTCDFNHVLKPLVKFGRVIVGPDHNMYMVEYRAHKFFKVCPIKINPDYNPNEPYHAKNNKKFLTDDSRGHSTRISDTQSFFQMAFVRVLDDWLPDRPDMIARIREGKELRESAQLDDDMIEYNDLECKALALIMERMRDACNDLGITPTQWEGPGYLASALMTKYGVPRRKDYEDALVSNGWGILLDLPDSNDVGWGRRAYYGGRFEVQWYGPINRPVYELDIASAYPYAMLSLPCLIHGKWERSGTVPGEIAIIECAYEPKHGDKAMFYALPFRTQKGSVCWPALGAGWYWSFEVAEARHQNITVIDSWTYTKRCDCNHFSFIPELFKARKAMGKSAKGMILKLAMNSMYGKLAQSIGNPPFANHVLSSFILAHCRTRIMQAIHAHGCELDRVCGENVAMIATDAIYLLDPPVIPTGKGLGDWELTTHPDGLFIIQPGVYYGAQAMKPKMRGTPINLMKERRHDFEASYAAMVKSGRPDDGTVYIPYRRFIGIRDAVHRNNPRSLGRFISLGGDDGKKIGFAWESKRAARPLNIPGPNEPLQTGPIYPPFLFPEYSTIYPKRITAELDLPAGMMDQELNDTPEWVPQIAGGLIE